VKEGRTPDLQAPIRDEPDARTNVNAILDGSQDTEAANEITVLQKRHSRENCHKIPDVSVDRPQRSAHEAEQQRTDEALPGAGNNEAIELMPSISRGYTIANNRILEEDRISSSGSSINDEPDEPVPRPTTARMSTARTAATKRDPLILSGRYEVKKVVSHMQVGARREFKLRFVDGSEHRVRESDCDNCVELLMNHCNRGGTRQTGLPQPRAGASGKREPTTENWVTPAEVIKKGSIYGKRDGIQPPIVEEKKLWDSSYHDQVRQYFFVVLYPHERNLAPVAGGRWLESTPGGRRSHGNDIRGLCTSRSQSGEI